MEKNGVSVVRQRSMRLGQSHRTMPGSGKPYDPFKWLPPSIQPPLVPHLQESEELRTWKGSGGPQAEETRVLSACLDSDWNFPRASPPLRPASDPYLSQKEISDTLIGSGSVIYCHCYFTFLRPLFFPWRLKLIIQVVVSAKKKNKKTHIIPLSYSPNTHKLLGPIRFSWHTKPS